MRKIITNKTMKTILIVDDNAEFRANLAKILKTAGYEVVTASGCMDAINKCSATRFDVLLIDVVMPEKNGLELLKDLKEIRPSAKAVMITAFATVNDAVQAMKMGACDYISKPFRAEELVAMIRRTLEELKFEDSLNRLNLDDSLASLANPTRRAILQMLFDKPGLRLMDVCRALDMSEEHTKALFHLNILKEHGIISQEERRYTLTAHGIRVMEMLKDMKKRL